MNDVEQQLVALFSLLDWQAIYHPLCFCDKTGDLFDPSFYIHSARLFVHYGDTPWVFQEKVIYEKCWRFLPGCPRPREGEKVSMLDLIQQPALLEIEPKACHCKFLQSRDMPGEPKSTSMVHVARCSSCDEWSPLGGFSEGVCRTCGSREGFEEFFCFAQQNNKVALLNGWGESFILPRSEDIFTQKEFILYNPSDEPTVLEGLSIWGAFKRFRTGPPPEPDITAKVAGKKLRRVSALSPPTRH